jgi:hypothetical protein
MPSDYKRVLLARKEKELAGVSMNQNAAAAV